MAIGISANRHTRFALGRSSGRGMIAARQGLDRWLFRGLLGRDGGSALEPRDTRGNDDELPKAKGARGFSIHRGRWTIQPRMRYRRTTPRWLWKPVITE